MVEPDNKFMDEQLRKIQAGIVELRGAMTDFRSDVRDLKASNAMILNLIGDLVKATARDDDRFARLEARVEDIEHRLDQDHLPAS
jgi:hypothetical protein